jgi:hypothetical protein
MLFSCEKCYVNLGTGSDVEVRYFGDIPASANGRHGLVVSLTDGVQLHAIPIRATADGGTHAKIRPPAAAAILISPVSYDAC